MLFDPKIVGLVKESNSQLNVGKDTGRIDFRKGGEGGGGGIRRGGVE